MENNVLLENNELIKDLKEAEKEVEQYKNVLNTESQETDLEPKRVLMMVNPETGTKDAIGEIDESDYENLEDPFENLSDSIEDVDIEDSIEDNTPITDEEMSEYISDPDNNSIMNELDSDYEISNEATKDLLAVVNRKISGEKFNTYRELPQEIKDIIDKYVTKNAVGINNAVNLNIIKKNVADALLDDFINDIQLKRIKNDFATDLENIYKDSIKDIAAGTLEYIDERNKLYREKADEIEDEEKKAKMLAILDQIDEARSLTQLKEYAKHCKIKSIELEKPDNRVYSNFLFKYKNSSNNIYDINLAKKVLFRHIEKDGYTIRDIDAFFVCFCKQVRNYSPAKPVEHAYMYYVLYYCALLDGDNSRVFIDNVEEVMNNLRQRNSII